MRYGLLATAVLVALTFTAHAEDWPQFRGPGGRAISETGNPPIFFNLESNLVWKTPVPSGYSSPVITGERLFLTGLTEGRIETISLQRKAGRELWRRRALGNEILPKSASDGPGPAAATPVTDGNSVFVFFGAAGLIAYDLDGMERWRQNLGELYAGECSSPILIGENIILQYDNKDGSFVEARDKNTGRSKWRVERPKFGRGLSTPFHWIHGKEQELVVAGSGWLTSYVPSTGAENWRQSGSSQVTTSSPASGEDLLFWAVSNMGVNDAEGGEAEPAAIDFNPVPPTEPAEDKNLLLSIHPGGTGELSSTQLAWKTGRGIPEASSPLFYRGRLFTIKNRGLVSAYEAKSGRRIFQNEDLNAPGSYSASPVAAAGRIYFASEDGTVTVVDATADHPVPLSKTALGEKIVATPAIIDQTIIIRTEKSLYCFGKVGPSR